MELKLYIGDFGNFKIKKFKKNTDKNTPKIFKKDNFVNNTRRIAGLLADI